MKTWQELEALALPELRALARDHGLRGYSRLKRDELLEALAEAHGITVGNVVETETSPTEAVVLSVVSSGPASLPEPSPVDHGFGFPTSYGVDRCVLMVRDPQWMFAYWDVSAATWDLLVGRGIVDPSNGWRRVLRLHDVTGQTDLVPTPDTLVEDLEVGGDSRDWYFQTPRANREYIVEFGYLSATGEFFCIAVSNVVCAPRCAPSDQMDGSWGHLYDEALRLSLVGGNPLVAPSSGDLGRRLDEILIDRLSSGPFSATLQRR